MAVFYTLHKDKEFETAISSYQDQNNTKPLEIWLSKEPSISNVEQIYEILHQVFMISDTYFIQGTSSTFAKIFDKCNPNNKDKLEFVAKHELCPSVWFESPQDFEKLFHSYEKAFCIEGLKTANNSLKTVSEHFINERLNTPHGFWSAIKSFHMNVKFQKDNQHNLIPNIELWLTKIPQAKEFVEPYCLPIKDELNFSHIAYAYLNHGMEIESKILKLYPKDQPEKLEIFKKVADYLVLSNSLKNHENKTKKFNLKL